MTLFVDVQGVPNAILELVKARILANRKRNKERSSAATAVKPEQPARRRYYSPVAPDRRPEPAAIPLGRAWLLVPSDNDLNAKVKGIPPFSFKQGVFELEDESRDNEPFIIHTSGGPGDQPYLEGAPGTVISQAYTTRPLLKKGNIRGITEECFFYLSSDPVGYSSMYVDLSILFISWSTYETTRQVFVRYRADTSEPNDGNAIVVDRSYASELDEFALPGSVLNTDLTAYGWHHVASVAEISGPSVSISLYLDGSRVARSDPLPVAKFWESYERQMSGLVRGLSRVRFEALRLDPGTASHRVAGIRYTERALYTGDSFTPPTSITRLA
jgi:hypothetical protein